MALADLTFKLYTDAGLTAEYNGLSQLVHETDLSDNPQDFIFYLGSNTAGRILEANSNPGVDDITLTPTNTLAEWAATTAYTVGNMLEPVTPNTFVYRCTTAGTSAGSEPTWPTAAIGDTVADGTVVWTLVGKRHEITEIKLALTAGGLPGATGGDALAVATSIASGVGTAVPIHMRITNAVTTVQSNTGYPNIAVYVNELLETEV